MLGSKSLQWFSWELWKSMEAVKKQSVRKDLRSRARRQQERTLQTRVRLLVAAEKIFARDGFEAAKLEEIATEAGYTRGAFYVNFSSKEELFIALLADQVEKRMSRAALAAQAIADKPNYLAVMRENYVQSLKDPTWNLLFLEYKFFILRHPEFKEKVLEMQNKAFARTAATLDAIYSQAGFKLPVSTLAAATALGAIANTLGIDLLIGRAITEKEVDIILGVFFDALVAARPAREQ
jgi:AcrR family transcriptional regulator